MKKRVMISQCLGNIGNQLFCLFSGYYAAKKFSGNGYDIYILYSLKSANTISQ